MSDPLLLMPQAAGRPCTPPGSEASREATVTVDGTPWRRRFDCTRARPVLPSGLSSAASCRAVGWSNTSVLGNFLPDPAAICS
eukprot:2577210-Prymnesium_polylepis.1